MIDSGTRADVFRARMEDTNQLKQKGSLYAGTGKTTRINSVDVYNTTEITPPLSDSSVLVKDDSKDGGLGWKDVVDVVNGSSGKIENCVNAEKAQDSTNVTSTINKKQISDIFEEDGVTVKKSTNSEYSVLADNATKTSFTNKTFQSGSANNITLTEAGTYQFRGIGTNYPNFGLVYWNGTDSACSVVASTLTSGGEATKYLLKISESGKIVVYYEEISGFESTNIINISDNWIEEDQDFYLYYRKID